MEDKIREGVEWTTMTVLPGIAAAASPHPVLSYLLY